MNYKARKETKTIKVILMDTSGFSVEQLHKEARKVGKLGVDFHYLVHRRGSVETGRKEYMIAGNALDSSQESICIVVNSPTGKLTDCQEVAMEDLCSSISGTYPDVIVSKSKKM